MICTGQAFIHMNTFPTAKTSQMVKNQKINKYFLHQLFHVGRNMNFLNHVIYLSSAINIARVLLQFFLVSFMGSIIQFTFVISSFTTRHEVITDAIWFHVAEHLTEGL